MKVDSIDLLKSEDGKSYLFIYKNKRYIFSKKDIIDCIINEYFLGEEDKK